MGKFISIMGGIKMDSKTLENRMLNLSVFFISIFIVLLLRKSQFNNLGVIVFFTTILVLIMRKTDICVEIKFILLFSYVFRIMYSYYLYNNDLIRFPDTIGYIKTLDNMVKNEPISYSKVVKYAGTLHVSYHYLNYFLFKVFNTNYSLYLGNIFLFFLSVILLYQHIKNRFNLNIASIVIFINVKYNIYIYFEYIKRFASIIFMYIFNIFL